MNVVATAAKSPFSFVRYVSDSGVFVPTFPEVAGLGVAQLRNYYGAFYFGRGGRI